MKFFKAIKEQNKTPDKSPVDYNTIVQKKRQSQTIDPLDRSKFYFCGDQN